MDNLKTGTVALVNADSIKNPRIKILDHFFEYQFLQLLELLLEGIERNMHGMSLHFNLYVEHDLYESVSINRAKDIILEHAIVHGNYEFQASLKIFCIREVPHDVLLWNTEVEITNQVTRKGFEFMIDKETIDIESPIPIKQKKLLLNGILFRLIKSYDTCYCTA